MTTTLTNCPICGEHLEATVSASINVFELIDGQITSWEPADGDADESINSHVMLNLRCSEYDCTFDPADYGIKLYPQ